MTNESSRALTPGMRRLMIIVAVAVLVGAAIAVWFIAAGGSGPAAQVSPSTAQTPTRGPIPGATATAGSEVVAPQPEQTQGEPDRIPPLPTPTPLVTAPLPESGSASGSLVAGFPADIMGPAPDSEVVDSSIATEASTMQVTLVGRTNGSPSDVSAHYQALWEGLGLIGTPVQDGLSYSGDFESFTLGFSSSGTGTVYSVFGVLRTN